jgi:uncharacterized membrane protein
MQNPSYNPDYGAGAAKSSTGLDANIAALLSYLFGLLSGVIFYVIEKDSKFVKFHAMQSILFNVVVAVIAIGGMIILGILGVVLSSMSDALGIIYSIIMLGFWLIFMAVVFVAAILCLYKAFKGQMFKLPVIGNMAEKIVNK